MADEKQQTPQTVDRQIFGVDLKIVLAFALLVYTGTNRLSVIENDINNLKQSAEVVTSVRSDQQKSSNDMAALQVEVASIKNAQAVQANKLDEISKSINVVSQQVQSVTQAIQQRR